MRYKRVIYGIDWTRPLVSYIYTVLVASGGAYIWYRAFDKGISNLFEVVFFAGLLALAECLHVRLPHVNGFVSVGSSICLAALLCLGAPSAALATSLGVMCANLFWAALPLDSILFNAGQLAITTLLSAMAYKLAGGVSGVPLAFPQDLLPLVAGMFVYAFCNVSLVTVGIGLDTRKPISGIWLASFKWIIPNYACLGSLGVLAAEIYYSSLSIYGILLLWIPLLFARYSFQQYWEIRRAHLKTIEALALALDARDPYTRGHSERVSFYANSLATRLGFNDVDIELVRFAGILHDIGKIGISDFILNKKGTLDPLEFALIQGHPGIGADMIKSIGFLENVGHLIRYHHERFNGTGYPDGLAFEKIPIGARIISVADAFDAMTCDRVYRPGMSYDEAIKRLIDGKGTQFDPKMVDCFVDVWENVLDNGRLAPQPVRTSGNMAVNTETIAETSSLVAATKE